MYSYNNTYAFSRNRRRLVQISVADKLEKLITITRKRLACFALAIKLKFFQYKAVHYLTHLFHLYTHTLELRLHRRCGVQNVENADINNKNNKM